MSLACSEITGSCLGADLAPPEASLIDGLCQRARLLELILADLLGPQTILYRNLMPASLVSDVLLRGGTTRSANPRLIAYAAELVLCPDEIWRVAGDLVSGVGNHPAAQLLEAPALAGFLPRLCRSLLRETLLVGSLPSRWLADCGALQEVVANLPRWTIVDACRRGGPATPLAGLTPMQRSVLQDQIVSEPGRFAARMRVEGRTALVALTRKRHGYWIVTDRTQAADVPGSSLPSCCIHGQVASRESDC